MYDETILEKEKRIKDEIKVEAENVAPFDIKINFVNILTFIIGIIAFTLLLWEILPVSIGYGFTYKNYVHMLHLKYLIIYLPYAGLIISIVLFVKKKHFKSLFIFSIFSILYPFSIPTIKYINNNFHTNIAERPQDDSTPLYFAVRNNQKSKVKILLEHGANPNEKFNYHEELVYTAIDNNNFDILKLLIEYEAKVNRFNYFDGTPLHLAVKKNNVNIVEFLLKNHSPVNAKTKYHAKKGPFGTNSKDTGKTSLHIAVINNYPEIAIILLKNGADPYIKDNDSKDAFTYAKSDNMNKLLKQSYSKK